jgi:cell division septation protein DedD
MKGEVEAVTEQESAEPVVEAVEPTPPESYDLESEMLEDTAPDDQEAFEEEIKPIEADTFAVEDLSPTSPSGAEYGVGFRIQVFASSDLEKARLFKEKVTSEAGLTAYIEYEGGLYKVRAGDFHTREQAVAARARLAPLYPDCWIVETTVMK